MAKNTTNVTPEVKAKAKELREKLKNRPPIEELLTPEEQSDATPFYFALRSFVAELKDARLAGGMTLAEVAERSGLAVETLSRLETGAMVNPTWQTLARYASAVGRRPRLVLEAGTQGSGEEEQEPGAG
jgi:DNA-binding XRE family transcriptional regulator